MLSTSISRPQPFTRGTEIKSTSFISFVGRRFAQFNSGKQQQQQHTAIRRATTYAGSQDSAPVDWAAVGTRVGLAVAGGFAINYFLNRETRGALSPYEANYLNSCFKWTGAGLIITAAVAKGLHSSGFAVRLMAANPWLVMGGGLVAGIGSMMGVYYTEPGTPLHYACWALFSGVQGATLSPMFFLNPAVLSRAGLYTLGALGGLSYVGATAHNEQFLYMGGALMAGLGVILVTSLAPMVLPRMSMRTLSVMENVSAYGGVAVFSGFILYDTQKVSSGAWFRISSRIPR